MGFDIETFHAEVNAGDGPMRDNRFEFVIPRHGNGLSRFWASDVNFPGKQNATSDVRRHGYGVIEKRPNVTNFTQIRANFMNDNNNVVWGFLNQWMADIIPHNTSNGIQGQYLVEYKDEYRENVYINVYDNAGYRRSIIQLMEAFPTQMSDVPLSWQAVNTPFIFQVDFDFLTWNVLEADGDFPNTDGMDFLPSVRINLNL